MVDAKQKAVNVALEPGEQEWLCSKLGLIARPYGTQSGCDGIIDTTIPMLLISHSFRLVVFGIPALSLRVLNLFVSFRSGKFLCKARSSLLMSLNQREPNELTGSVPNPKLGLQPYGPNLPQSSFCLPLNGWQTIMTRRKLAVI